MQRNVEGAGEVRGGTFRWGGHPFTHVSIHSFLSSVSHRHQALFLSVGDARTGMHQEGCCRVSERFLGSAGKKGSVPGRKKTVETNTASSNCSECGRNRQERGGRWETRERVSRSTGCKTARKELRMCGNVDTTRAGRDRKCINRAQSGVKTWWAAIHWEETMVTQVLWRTCVGHQDIPIASLLWPNAINYLNQTTKSLLAWIPWPPCTGVDFLPTRARNNPITLFPVYTFVSCRSGEGPLLKVHSL